MNIQELIGAIELVIKVLNNKSIENKFSHLLVKLKTLFSDINVLPLGNEIVKPHVITRQYKESENAISEAIKNETLRVLKENSQLSSAEKAYLQNILRYT